MRTPLDRNAAQTPSQTVGPYFAMILAKSDEDAVMAGPDVAGEHITVTGRLLDGNGDPIEDGLIEIWQANAAGRYRHSTDDRDDVPLEEGFTGFGRAKTGFDDGVWTIRTVRPGPVPHPGGAMQAPHLNVVVQARGMLNPSFTRIYFSDEAKTNEVDPVLTSVDPERRHTLIASRDDGGEGTTTFTFDIHMQGPDETVFLDW